MKKEYKGRANINLYNCDNMEFMKGLPDNYYDLAIVDPPYGIERFKKVSEKDLLTKSVHAKRFQNMGLVNDNKPLQEYWDELFRITKNQIVWGANNFTMPQSEYFLIWDKKQAMPNFARCEYAWVSVGLKTPAKICEHSIHIHNQTEKIHPTQKPIYLYKYILENYCKQGDKILDTHGGSMSIAVACWDYGFDLDLCELDKEYFDKGVERFENHIKQQKLF